jgi:hypothetical protein
MPSSLPLIKFNRSASQYCETALPAGMLPTLSINNPGLLYIKIHSIPTATFIANDAQGISTTAP